MEVSKSQLKSLVNDVVEVTLDKIFNKQKVNLTQLVDSRIDRFIKNSVTITLPKRKKLDQKTALSL